jgi:putative transcriptional regulator
VQVASAPIITNMPGIIRVKVSEVAGRRKMQISDLAREADVSYDTAKRFWHATAEGVTWEVLTKFCDALNCSVEELLEYIPETRNNGDR